MRNLTNIARHVESFERTTDDRKNDEVANQTQVLPGQRAKTAEKLAGVRPLRRNAAHLKSLRRHEGYRKDNETLFSAKTLTQGYAMQDSY